MDINFLIDDSFNIYKGGFKRLVQRTYFDLNPLNPKNIEDNYQELLKENLKLAFDLKCHIETSQQKTSSDINGEVVKFKHKTERYDIVIEQINTILELKCLVDITDESRYQLFNYLDKSVCNHGIIINFMKFNTKNLFAQVEVYEKSTIHEHQDKFGDNYSRYYYKNIHSFQTEDFYNIVGRYTQEGVEEIKEKKVNETKRKKVNETKSKKVKKSGDADKKVVNENKVIEIIEVNDESCTN